MMVAQQLYEGLTLGSQGHQGLITYMRTDSTRISPVAQSAAHSYIAEQFGEKYSKHGSKVKNASGAQDAIKMPTKPFDLQMSLIHLSPLLNIWTKTN